MINKPISVKGQEIPSNGRGPGDRRQARNRGARPLKRSFAGLYVCIWPLAAVQFGQFRAFLTSGIGESGHSAKLGVRVPPQTRHLAILSLNDR